jgi:hypothetical protein
MRSQQKLHARRRADLAHAEMDHRSAAVGWLDRDLFRTRHAQRFEAAESIQRRHVAAFIHAETLRYLESFAAPAAQAVRTDIGQFQSARQGLPVERRLLKPWAQMLPLPIGFFQSEYVWPPGPETIQPDFAELRFLWPAVLVGKLRFGRPFFSTNPIPVRRVYIVIPDVVVTRVSSGDEISCSGFRLLYDADSHSWSGEIGLIGPNALDQLEPDGNNPVILNVHANGYDWRMIADRWAESVRFGGRGIRVSARGITASLCSPWSERVAGTVESSQTVQQVFQGLLPFGWTIDWQAGVAPWIVPAGAWSWAGNASLPTIHQAAQALGLMVQPDRITQDLTVLARYPVLPWAYAAATPTLTVPLAAVTAFERNQPVATQANAVIAHGGEPGGVIGQVQRTGSAGDLLAETISHPLITHIDAARVAGQRVLAAQHQTPEWAAITIPLGGDFPLINVGDLVEIDIGGSNPRSTASAVEVSAQRAGRGMSVRQAITLNEDTPNEYRRFRAILPGDPTYLAEVISTSGGTSLVELLTGDRIRVQGTSSPGQMVYVNVGRIIGQAPSLPASLINV